MLHVVELDVITKVAVAKVTHNAPDMGVRAAISKQPGASQVSGDGARQHPISEQAKRRCKACAHIQRAGREEIVT